MITVNGSSHHGSGTRPGILVARTINPFVSDPDKESTRSQLRVLPNLPTPPLSSGTTPSNQNPTGVEPPAVHGVDVRLSPPDQVATEQHKPWYDVYAKPYIPASLRAINEESPGHIISTETTHKIEYGNYITRFAGRDYLTHQGSLDYDWPQDASSPTTELSEHSYVQYFAHLLHDECQANEAQNHYYTLFAVPLHATTLPDLTRLWALVIPGLREDNPLVEMGDALQIRQLWVDWAGRPMEMPLPTVGAQGQYVAYHSWTGVQYNASVHSVSRIQETVYLRIDGLQHLTPLYHNANVLPMVVNVVFPLKERILQGQRKALVLIDRSLEACREHPKNLDSLSKSSLGTGPEAAHPSLQSASQTDWARRMLFPSEHDGRLQTKLRGVPHRALFDHAVNYEQAHAVNSICKADYGTLPYLISGPPGTGKTKTLVEVAMQLLNTTDMAHMLICAPSEAAADTLALRLKQYLTPKQLLRLNGPNRADNEVPRELLQYCYMQDDMFYLPPFKTLLAFRVVITSCRGAAILAKARLTNADLWSMERDLVSALHPDDEPPIPSLHWGALLLDEAAQATEIDVLPAITVVCPPPTYPEDRAQPRMVMAGDEHQLGPRTASQDPSLTTSLFARLFARPLYVNHPLSRSNVKPSSGPPVLQRSMLPLPYPPFTNLIRNYRSHPSILSVPSSLFYHDTLIPESSFPTTPLQSSPLWHGRKWPVLYIPHASLDELERDNGGWYNVSEARLACSLAETLVLHSSVKQEDICIMSPFAAQVKLLRSTIRSKAYAAGRGLWDVNIGPVEAFQGLEKRVVILCTTRTRMRFVAEDGQRGMGLVMQRRKMNVALTRAKEGLIVIGSPEVMGVDESWRAWMAFCERNGLVDDRMRVWGNRASSRDGRVGVLERALVAKEEGMRERQWPALGAAAADYDVDGGEYEAWTESLRQALEDEEDEKNEDHSEADGSSTPDAVDAKELFA